MLHCPPAHALYSKDNQGPQEVQVEKVNLRECVLNSRQPDPRRVWKGGTDGVEGHDQLDPGNPGTPGMSSERLVFDGRHNYTHC